jgi:hypothetical protein
MRRIHCLEDLVEYMREHGGTIVLPEGACVLVSPLDLGRIRLVMPPAKEITITPQRPALDVPSRDASRPGAYSPETETRTSLQPGN